MRQYFLQMPGELADAARVDGAIHFRVFYRIYLPIALPPMATLGSQLRRVLGTSSSGR